MHLIFKILLTAGFAVIGALLLILLLRSRLQIALQNGRKDVALAFAGEWLAVRFSAEYGSSSLAIFLRGWKIVRFSPGRQKKTGEKKEKPAKPVAAKKESGKRQGIRFWLSRNWEELKAPAVRLLRRVHNLELNGYLKIGTKNPFLLGALYGIYAMFRGLIPQAARHFTLLPNFRQSMTEYSLQFQAEFRPIALVLDGTRLWLTYRRVVRAD